MPHRFLAKFAAPALNLLACLALLTVPAQAQEAATEPAAPPQQVEVVQTSTDRGFPWGLLGLFGLLGLGRRRAAKVVYLPAGTSHATAAEELDNSATLGSTGPSDTDLSEVELVEEHFIDGPDDDLLDEPLEAEEPTQTIRIVPHGSDYDGETEVESIEADELEDAEPKTRRRFRRR